jgi:hypothetical protein
VWIVSQNLLHGTKTMGMFKIPPFSSAILMSRNTVGLMTVCNHELNLQ